MLEVMRQTVSVSLTAVSLQTGKTTASPTPEQLRSREEADQAHRLRRDMAAARKANARAMVDRLKEQISKLSVMAIISPKAMAQIIGTMSRQLATAAAEYSRDGSLRDIDASARTADDSRAQATLSAAVLTVDVSRAALTVADGEDLGDAIDADLAAAAAPDGKGDTALAEVSRTTISLVMAELDTGNAAAAAPSGKLKAYVDPERQADEKFSRTIRELRKILETLFDTAIRQAERQDEIEKVIRDFSASNARIRDAEKTIAGWWADQPVVEMTTAAPTDITA